MGIDLGPANPRISPLIKLSRWSLLIGGIMWGMHRYNVNKATEDEIRSYNARRRRQRRPRPTRRRWKSWPRNSVKVHLASLPLTHPHPIYMQQQQLIMFSPHLDIVYYVV